MSEQRKADAAQYLKEVLRNSSKFMEMPHDFRVSLSEIILHAYLRGRDDEGQRTAMQLSPLEVEALAQFVHARGDRLDMMSEDQFVGLRGGTKQQWDEWQTKLALIARDWS